MKRNSLLRWAGAGLLAVGVALSMAAPATAGADTSARTVADLSVAQVKLDKAAATRPGSVTGWYVDKASRSLVVEVHGSDAAVSDWASTLGAGAVMIKHVPQAYEPMWNIIGGQAIRTSSGSRCSAGFNARTSSARYVITAGHCTDLGGTWSGPGGTIGRVAGSSFPGNDYGAIHVASSSAVSTPRVDRYSAGSDVTVTGAASAFGGMAVCRSGSTTGWHCGSVTATNQTVCYAQGCVFQMIRTNVCAEPGDSGGSLVTNPGSGSRVRAVGLTSGGSGNCRTGGTTFFQPITEPLSVWRLTLYTG
ncbi:S1 family peptidase [Actinophytocola sp.]|uniref:S1 family peptidase n=1 Tax=Actinophytocola sp. TaxID=1872138 RepID=UPI003D6B84D8